MPETLCNFFQQDTLSSHTANNSMHRWRRVFGARQISRECTLTFARSEAMSLICTSFCGACWRTKCNITILSLQTAWQKLSGSNAFNLTNKSWTCTESHVICVECLQAGLNHFCAPNFNRNTVNYIRWTPTHEKLEKWRKLCGLPPWGSIWEEKRAISG